MSLSSASWFARLLPQPHTAGPAERFRASVGALIGLALTGMLCHGLGGTAGLWLIAPMGASSVLLFAVPASPLAQPWSVVGGNSIAALVGVTCALLIEDPLMAAPFAGGLAIAAMFALRCLHPPGGAVALTAVLAGPQVHALGYGFVLYPVLVNSALMVLGALAYNNLTGRRYPHTQQSTLQNTHATHDPAPTERVGFTRADLDAVLARYDQVLDVSRDDLEQIIMATEIEADRRRFGVIRCGDIMSRDVAALQFATELDTAWRLMRVHRVHALPVLNRARRVIGVVTQSDFLAHCNLDDFASIGTRIRTLLGRTRHTHSDKPEVVGQIMTSKVSTARPDTPIAELVPLMANVGHHHIPIVDHEDRFVGIVTQSDLVAALYQHRLGDLRAVA